MGKKAAEPRMPWKRLTLTLTATLILSVFWIRGLYFAGDSLSWGTVAAGRTQAKLYAVDLGKGRFFYRREMAWPESPDLYTPMSASSWNQQFKYIESHEGWCHMAMPAAYIPPRIDEGNGSWLGTLGFEHYRWKRPEAFFEIWAIPAWSVVVPLALLAVRSVFRCRHVAAMRRRGRAGLCPKCGYDVRPSSERCPECGHAFERLESGCKADPC